MTQFNLDTMKLWPTFGWPLASTSTSVAALNSYGVLGFDPDFVLDFKNGVYKTGGSATTVNSAVTHTRSGNATMTDANGILRYAPHNLVRSSAIQLDAAGNNSFWAYTSVSKVTSSVLSPDGVNYATKFTGYNTSGGANTPANNNAYVRSGNTSNLTDVHNCSIWARTVSGTGTVALAQRYQNPASVVTLTEEWQRFSIQTDTTYPFVSTYYAVDFRAGTLNEVLLWGAQAEQNTAPSINVTTEELVVYAPRIGHHVYSGSEWVNEGLLHESEARTNKADYSNDFTSYKYHKNGDVTVSTTTTLAPDGSFATKVSGTRWMNHTTGLNQTTDRKSVWARTVSGTGTVGLLSRYNNAWSETTLTEEWQRFEAQCVPYPAGDSESKFYIVDFRVGNLSEILIFGAQVETNTTTSSYIPTTTSAVTRAADVLTVPAANLPYSSTNMSTQMDGKMNYAEAFAHDTPYEAIFYRWFSDSNSYIINRLSTAGSGVTGRFHTQQYEASTGLTQVESTGTQYAPSNSVPFNTASRHGSTFINGAVEGTLLTANTTPTSLPNLSSTDLSLGYDFMGTIGEFRMWSDDLTDNGIQEAST